MKQVFFGIILFLSSCVSICAQPATSNCPEIVVTGPSGVTKAGDPMTFTASIRHSLPDKAGYDWSVSSGMIESGQGTATIKVQTTKDMAGSNVTAMVKIRGVGVGCADTASEIAGVAPIPPICPLDEFGALSKYDIRARIDNLLIQLQQDPLLEAYLIVHLNSKDSLIFKKAYLNNMYDAIVFFKKDPSRITFLISEDESETRTVLYMLYPEGDPEKLGSKGSMLIKGEEFKQKIKTLFPINK